MIMNEHCKKYDSESNSVPATKATRGLGYQRKIRDSVGYLMRNEISLSLPSHQGTLGILSTDTILCGNSAAILTLALCLSMLQFWNAVCLSVMDCTKSYPLPIIFPRFWLSKFCSAFAPQGYRI